MRKLLPELFVILKIVQRFGINISVLSQLPLYKTTKIPFNYLTLKCIIIFIEISASTNHSNLPKKRNPPHHTKNSQTTERRERIRKEEKVEQFYFLLSFP